MFSLEEDRRQQAVHRRKSNDCDKRGLGHRSPNPVLANFLAVME